MSNAMLLEIGRTESLPPNWKEKATRHQATTEKVAEYAKYLDALVSSQDASLLTIEKALSLANDVCSWADERLESLPAHNVATREQDDLKSLTLRCLGIARRCILTIRNLTLTVESMTNQLDSLAETRQALTTEIKDRGATLKEPFSLSNVMDFMTTGNETHLAFPRPPPPRVSGRREETETAPDPAPQTSTALTTRRQNPGLLLE
ncbi:ORF3 protein [Lentinula edodes negative-strand RNA virus 1]|uniref:ORF3 n=1 Tax=Lentinula edodes negative-strand RNA virus 1 TaxID=2547430 RepID=A0A4P2VZM6_9MONO|nr:ORF3 protein [Lentinula edodes negative-strand RNA virus 1]QOX06034.1 ORF3 [Lentinula edodes negative-strand RNA virus 1]BBI93113.1 ORF3 protein [Lentinula edodes negative-strand RNA virus 1]